jgi:hypothetical protein
MLIITLDQFLRCDIPMYIRRKFIRLGNRVSSLPRLLTHFYKIEFNRSPLFYNSTNSNRTTIIFFVTNLSPYVIGINFYSIKVFLCLLYQT